MGDFINMMAAIFQFLRMPITIYGFTFTFYQVAIFVMLTGLVSLFVRGIFDYDE